MFDGIIFDVDGTLWDSTPVVEKAWNEALKDNGYGNLSVSADRLKGLFGKPMPEIIEAIMPDVSQKERDLFAPKCYGYEHRYLQKEPGIMYPKILDTIRELNKTHDIFIVSNCQAGYIELFLSWTDIGPIIKDHVCLGDNGLLKADNIKFIIDKHGLKNPVYIGDIQGDADASGQAGIKFIHAAYGFGKVKKEDIYAAVSEPWELIDIVS